MTAQPSITCPKCERKSYNSNDIDYRYCGDCGYMDVPEGTPEGIPGVSPKWRQPTPTMQLKAVCGSLEGHFVNWREGIISNEQFQFRFERHMKDIRELHGYVAKGEWPRKRNGPRPPRGGGHL